MKINDEVTTNKDIYDALETRLEFFQQMGYKWTNQTPRVLLADFIIDLMIAVKEGRIDPVVSKEA